MPAGPVVGGRASICQLVRVAKLAEKADYSET